jgi:uncharacterized membrane protein (UPF0127 family)
MKMRLKLLDILKESTGIVPFPFQNTKTIKIINDNGEDIPVNCELAQSPEEKSQGLLHRDELCGDCGVLFDSDGAGGYHMIGMEFPIEMVFINGKQIVDIIKANPGDENISPQGQYTRNLEVNDGFCVENGISVGCEVVE